MLKRWIFASVAATLVGCLTTPVPLTASSRFRASLNLLQVSKTVDVGRCGGEPRVLIGLEGEGTVSRIGRVTAVASHCTEDDPTSIPFDGAILVVSAAEGAQAAPARSRMQPAAGRSAALLALTKSEGASFSTAGSTDRVCNRLTHLPRGERR